MSEGNGSSNGNGASVGKQRVKKLGGVTGKGFQPGRSGNPTGKNTRGEMAVFGGWLRKWLLEKRVFTGVDGQKVRSRRLEWVVNRLAEVKPDVLLHYAYGKPVEMVELSGAEGGAVDFMVKVDGKQLPLLNVGQVSHRN